MGEKGEEKSSDEAVSIRSPSESDSVKLPQKRPFVSPGPTPTRVGSSTVFAAEPLKNGYVEFACPALLGKLFYTPSSSACASEPRLVPRTRTTHKT